MQSMYTNTLLTIIALLLCAIAAKLYIPATQEYGIRISHPTVGDVRNARSIKDQKEKREEIEELRARTPVFYVSGGDIDVSGSSIEVRNTVEVEGKVSIEQSPY
jgi:hypothetical protein